MTALEIAALLSEGHGVLLRRDHPRLASALTRAAARQQLVTVLPGVFVAPGTEDDPGTRMRALAALDPDVIFTGAAAAKLTYWPELKVPIVSATRRYHRAPQRGYAFHRRRIPAELVMERFGLRCTVPSLTALDLSDLDNSDALDTALRTRAVTLDALHEALRRTPNHVGEP